jgi:hypothetical protein
MPESVVALKTCARCGRRFDWRADCSRNWEALRYCSDRCRRQRLTDSDRALESQILVLLTGKPQGATICPSEAARLVRPEDWREWQEPSRQAARRLVAAGKLDFLQKGRVVDPTTAKGPVRLRLRVDDA